MDIGYKLRRIRRWAAEIGGPAALWFECQRTLRRPVIRVPHCGLRRPVWLRGTGSDISVFEQVFIQHELKLDLDFSPRVIVDGGANCGLTTLDLALRFPSATIVAIEPDGGNCAMLARNTRGLGNVRIVRAALWSHPTRLRIVNPDDEPWAYRCIETAPDDPDGFDGLNLDTVLRQQGLADCDFVKLDIEGAETEMFRAPGSWLDQVRAMLIEVHGGDAGALIRRQCPEPAWTHGMLGEKLLLRHRQIDLSAPPETAA